MGRGRPIPIEVQDRVRAALAAHTEVRSRAINDLKPLVSRPRLTGYAPLGSQ